MHIPASFTAPAVLCVLSTFLSRPSDTKVWLTSANDDCLRFAVPAERLRERYVYLGFIVFAWLGDIIFSFHVPWSLYIFLFLGIVGIPVLLYLFSFAGITIYLKDQTYEAVRRWPWGTRIYKGPLDDFRAVYIPVQGSVGHVSVGLVYRRPGLRLDRLVPLGSAGFGGDAARLAQEVGRKTGLPVVNSL